MLVLHTIMQHPDSNWPELPENLLQELGEGLKVDLNGQYRLGDVRAPVEVAASREGEEKEELDPDDDANLEDEEGDEDAQLIARLERQLEGRENANAASEAARAAATVGKSACKSI